MTPHAPPASGTVRTALEPMHPREEPAPADIPVDTPPGAPRKNHRALTVGLGLGATLLLLQTLYALGGLLQQSPVLGMAWSVVFVLVLGAGGRAAWGMWRKLRRLRFQRDMRTRVQELLVHNGLSDARSLCDQLATEAGQLQSPAYLRWCERLEDTHNDREVLRLYGRMVLAEADTRALERVSSHAGDVAVMVVVSYFPAVDMLLVLWRISGNIWRCFNPRKITAKGMIVRAVLWTSFLHWKRIIRRQARVMNNEIVVTSIAEIIA